MNNKIKGRIIKLLQKEDIEIDVNELDEVLIIYENILNFLGNNDEDECNYDIDINEMYKFTSLFCLEPITTEYFRLLVNLVKLKRRDLLKYLDYVFLLDVQLHSDIHPAYTLAEYTDKLLSLDPKIVDDKVYNLTFHGKYFGRYSIIMEIASYYAKAITESGYVPHEYKKVFELYSNILSNYFYEIAEDKAEGNTFFSLANNYSDKVSNGIIKQDIFYFDDFICATFNYFLKNGLLMKELHKIYSFLNEYNKDPVNISETLNMNGINCYDKLYDYIDFLYKNYSYQESKHIR